MACILLAIIKPLNFLTLYNIKSIVLLCAILDSRNNISAILLNPFQKELINDLIDYSTVHLLM